LIAAGTGVRVCKHGNRAASSSVGTADVLEALGVVVDLGPEGVAACVAEAGMGFCFAPRFHPAYRHVGPVRRQLGVPTVFNFLGPLANPARVRHQLVGVSDPVMAEKMAGVLGANGSVHAMVMFADDGLDELSVTSPSTVIELVGDGEDYRLTTWRLDAADLGIERAAMSDLSGGDAAFNASAIRRVLEGEPGPHRDIGVLNAAAALVVCGQAADLASGVAIASDSLDSGAAASALERLVATSLRVAGPS
ncbi:MAG TPA: anthranilate phosphoribosyltransferase, partial [Acidimicrobiales bacterium]|nr:anthranilate phosphoribosyltransferase [Acidimicrobiales bacterium]